MLKSITTSVVMASLLVACNQKVVETPSAPMEEHTPETTAKEADFKWQTEQFADIRILRYQIPGWEKLSAQQKMYVYHLSQAGLAGRDIIYDQNYRHNLEIRKALEKIVAAHPDGDADAQWEEFMIYTKRIWFSNGIHHHYSNLKFTPGFSQEYFNGLASKAGVSLSEEATKAVFDPSFDAKKVNKAGDVDIVAASAVNFYSPDITQAEVEAFYAKKNSPDATKPLSIGLNSTVVRNDAGELIEEVWYAEGKYGTEIKEIIGHLEAAIEEAENGAQKVALMILVEYYQTGDLQKWDDYNVAWVQATGGDVDYINGFIEVYNDPMGRKASFETIVQVRDLEASEQLSTVSQNVQWFEDNSSIMDEHKKPNVKGVTYRIINAVGEAGDASPSTPIGVNLPNANWIREEHGSKSISLGNIEHAYEKAAGKGLLAEFAYSAKEREIAEKYGDLGGRLHTALHEVVGHASGRLNPGVGQPAETLKNYASTLEEARADLVALYFLPNQKMIDLGLMEDFGPARAEYDNYIRNGMMLQLRRLNPGEEIEEDHMRNRQLVASWAMERGAADNVIEKKVVDGKTYFVINDYDKLQIIFGELLKEIQRIKSEGDFEAGKALVEGYGVKVDPELHREVLERSSKLNIAPYAGFINPVLVPVMENGKMVDVKVEYPSDFTQQHMMYGSQYSH